jgi:hypothetical protein
MWKKVSKFKYLSLDIVLWKIGVSIRLSVDQYDRIDGFNRYYSQIHLRNRENVKPNARMNLWYETSANEIKQFLGLTLNIGIVEKPSILLSE